MLNTASSRWLHWTHRREQLSPSAKKVVNSVIMYFKKGHKMPDSQKRMEPKEWERTEGTPGGGEGGGAPWWRSRYPHCSLVNTCAGADGYSWKNCCQCRAHAKSEERCKEERAAGGNHYVLTINQPLCPCTTWQWGRGVWSEGAKISLEKAGEERWCFSVCLFVPYCPNE